MNKINSCFQCGDNGQDLHGHFICESCKTKLKLFTDETIKFQSDAYPNPKSGRSYAEEIQYRLEFIENRFIKQKMKLLHIQERLKKLKIK